MVEGREGGKLAALEQGKGGGFGGWKEMKDNSDEKGAMVKDGINYMPETQQCTIL